MALPFYWIGITAFSPAPDIPEETSGSFTAERGELCAFRVLGEFSGKMGTIELPDGGTIFTFPGLSVTLTNLDNVENQVTLSVTGSFHNATLENGNVQTVFTGRNLIFQPQLGFVLAIREFTSVFDAENNVVEPLSGEGQLIDVCGLLD
jgi:hypothetical protein